MHRNHATPAITPHPRIDDRPTRRPGVWQLTTLAAVLGLFALIVGTGPDAAALDHCAESGATVLSTGTEMAPVTAPPLPSPMRRSSVYPPAGMMPAWN